jgi:LmbE family N-acetylglucosaminyl deacetylase
VASSVLRSSREIPGPILVVAAHPDDIEVHGGGTVAQLVAQGKQVSCVLCTSGNRGTANPEVSMEEIAATREREQRTASDTLGVTDLRFLRHDDGDLAFIVPQLREEIVRLLREIKPRTVITHDPYPGDGGQDSCAIYPDHTTVGLVTFQSAFVCAPGPLFYPEHLAHGLSPHKPESLYLVMSANPSVVVDITETWPAKQAAIRQHKSQGRATPECDREMERINRENGRRAGVEFGEAFRVLQPS